MDRLDSCDREWESPGGDSSEERQVDAVVTDADAKRACIDCGASKTPLWRSGPAGPKSLCNACGIRNRKKRRAILGVKDKKSKKSCPGSNENDSASLNRGILSIGKHVGIPRSRKKVKCEEEQAAVLLMTLSYGSLSTLPLVEMRGAK